MLNSSCLRLSGQQGLLGLPPGLASGGLDSPGHHGLVHRLLLGKGSHLHLRGHQKGLFHDF